jgi:predicted homoserine dehydrogenase-like protein
MIIVDKALEKREEENNPIRVGLVGAGYMGRGITLQVEKYIPGMKIVAISNRTISRADNAYQEAGIESPKIVETVAQLENAIASNRQAITDDALLLCQADNVDAVIESTGDVEFGAHVVLKAIENQKHIVLMNAELDTTVGPILKVYADRAGVVITNADGDQPGVMMNLVRFVRSIGYHPVLAGNIKGLQDHYRPPETQKRFAAEHNITPQMATSFADGTKICMENAIVANATGFKVGKRGMYGPRCSHVSEAVSLFPISQLLDGGLVDYILGAEPGPGVFVLGYNDHRIRQSYMKYFKMGEGPLYAFYVPYHLPHLEVPLTVARAVLFKDSAVAPLGGPVCDVITIAKRDLSDVGRYENLLPMGLAEGCLLRNDVRKDQVLTFADVELPSNRLCEKLWFEQNNYFA